MSFVAALYGSNETRQANEKKDDPHSSETLLEDMKVEDKSHLRRYQAESHHGSSTDIMTRIAFAFFAITSVLLLIAYINERHLTDQRCARQLSVWSPLSDAIEYEQVDFVNKPALPSLYRGAPTHKLEEEWEQLWFYGALSIPEGKMHLLNRTLDEPWSVQPDHSGFRALIEVFHQLHCLDIIRQYTWRDYNFQNPDKVRIPILLEDEMHAREHTDHCIEALRLALMCHGDVTPYLLKISPKAPQGVDPDFSPHHKCVKFDLLVEYMDKQKFRVESHNPR